MSHQVQGTIDLVKTSDPGYWAWCRSRRERTESGRRRDPFAQDYNAELMRWEAVVQQLLAAVIPDPIEERILVSQTHDRKGRATSIYLELDFVSGDVSAPDMFVEIKIREQSMNGKSGWPQLDRSLGIARTQWPNVRGICINVALGDVLQTEQECSNPTMAISELPDAIEDLSQSDGATIWICGTDVAAFAVDHHLLTCDDVRRLPELRQAMRNPTSVLKTLVAEPEANQPGLFDRFLHIR